MFSGVPFFAGLRPYSFFPRLTREGEQVIILLQCSTTRSIRLCARYRRRDGLKGEGR